MCRSGFFVAYFLIISISFLYVFLFYFDIVICAANLSNLQRDLKMNVKFRFSFQLKKENAVNSFFRPSFIFFVLFVIQIIY